MFPILQVGPLSIQAPPLILLLGLWLGLVLAEKYLPVTTCNTVTARQFNNLVWISALTGLIGARLAFVAQHSGAYLDNPLAILSTSLTSLNLEAGLFLASLAALIIQQRQKLNFWQLVDGLSPLLAVTMIAVALSNAASGNAFGSATTLPWGVELWAARRHPIQIYEALAAAAILWLVWPRSIQIWFAGERFLKWVIASAAARVFFEAFRGQTAVLTGNLRLAQVIAAIVLFVGLYEWHRRDREVPLA